MEARSGIRAGRCARPGGTRTTIDRLNTEMVDEVALHWSVLHSPDCNGTLDDAKTAVTNARTLDPLYQQALAFSTHSYCAP
jgi:chorismate mutase